MIEAQIKSIVPGSNGGDAKVFACSPALVLPENPSGDVVFYSAPPFWTGGRDPHPGQRVFIGSIERNFQPGWSRSDWLAKDVSPAFAIESYARGRLSEPTIIVSNRRPSTIWGRFLAMIGLKRQFGEQQN